MFYNEKPHEDNQANFRLIGPLPGKATNNLSLNCDATKTTKYKPRLTLRQASGSLEEKPAQVGFYLNVARLTVPSYRIIAFTMGKPPKDNLACKVVPKITFSRSGVV